MSIQPFNYPQLLKFWFSKNPLKMAQFSTKAKLQYDLWYLGWTLELSQTCLFYFPVSK